MKKLSKLAVVAAAMVLTAGAAFADQKGNDIMKQVKDFKEPKFNQSAVEMILQDKNGTQEVRKVMEYGRDKDGITSLVMIFMSPANVKDTRFLQETNDNGPDNKFIYLPSLKSVRRVNSSEGSKSFMGTDATYDDLSSRDLDEDTHEYQKEESKTVENGTTYDCYVVKETPVDAKSSQYAYRMVWVDKNTMYPIHTELFDKNNKMVKVIEILKMEKEGDYWIPKVDKLTNVQTGHSTSINIVKIVVDQPIPDRVFTQQFLSTGK